MDSTPQELQELQTLVRHVPRIVISSFMHRRTHNENGQDASSFTAVLAVFDISGFSTLGSNLSDLAKDQIKSLSLTTMKLDDFERSKLAGGATPPIDSAQNQPRDPDKVSSFEVREASQVEQSTVSSSSVRRLSSTAYSNPTVTQMLAVESLTTTLNKSLQPIIDVISRHSGDIIKFAGDTMIVLWETEISLQTKTPAGILAYRAARCAVEALRVLRGASKDSAPGAKLSMKVGIGTSIVTAHHVGGVLGRWEFYISGDANRQMSLALQHITKGNVALSLEAYGALAFSMATKELPSVDMKAKMVTDGIHVISKLSHSVHAQGERFPLKPSLELVPVLRGYIPGTIVSCLQRGLALTSCAREVTAIFVKLSGIVELVDSAQQAEEVHRVLGIIQSSAYKLQGTLKQFMLDGKSAVAIVIMGLPPFYHENNAVRGVKLACALLNSGIQASVGVTTGTAFCGPVGSRSRAEYAVVGASIDLAECIMNAAKVGEIFCDARTHEEAKDAVNFTVAHQISVRHRIDPVMIYCAVGEKGVAKNVRLNLRTAPPYDCEHVLALVPVFGDTMAQADEYSDSSNNRKCARRVLIVSGETGTGKTMLLKYLRNNHSRSFMDSGDSANLAMRLRAWSGVVRDMISQNVRPAQFNKANTARSISKGDKDTYAAIIDAQQTLVKSRSFSPGLKMERRSSEASRHAGPDANSLMRESMPLLEFLVLKGYTSNAMLPILNDLLPQDHLFKTDLSTLQHGEERARALEEIVVSMLSVLSKHRRILVLLDNAHFMGEDSWRLLQRVLDELPNVCAVLTVRSKRRVECPARLKAIGCMECTSQVELSRFSFAVTSLFVGREYRISIMDSTLLDFVYGRTDGNPAEIIKLVDFMIEQKFISIDRKRGTVKILADLDDLDTGVPQHTRVHVISCVDNLESLAQIAIKVISVHPEPVEEKLLVSILHVFLNSQHDGSSNDMVDIKIKPGRDSSFLGQLQGGLAVCLREGVLTIDDREQRYTFYSEEMRHVVYDMMIPSQRQLIHMLYCQWFTEMTERILGTVPDKSLKLEEDGSLLATANLHQNLARIGYHLLGAGNIRASLDAYRTAAEKAIEADDLYFASEYMISSQKILDEQPAHSKLFSELDLIVMRSRIEFIRGAIAIERSEWDKAVTHMTLILDMCENKGNALRRYSTGVYIESMVSEMTTTASLPSYPVSSTVTHDLDSPRKPSGQLDLLCMPRLFAFGSRKKKKPIQAAKRSSILIAPARVGPAADSETLEGLQQVSFFRKKAGMLIKIINESRLKQEAMTREIQRLMHQSLQT